MADSKPTIPSFRDLNLSAPLLTALDEVGYETPSPIQAQAIPHLLKGLDLWGHAPTGTGKTAAFALPLISRIDIANKQVQVMTLTPTRELAIQVAEAFQRYASHVNGFHVLPIYGGQDYTGQLRMLKRGVHVVVGVHVDVVVVVGVHVVVVVVVGVVVVVHVHVVYVVHVVVGIVVGVVVEVVMHVVVVVEF